MSARPTLRVARKVDPIRAPGKNSDRCDATPERARTLPPWWAYQDSAPLDLWSLPRPDVESGAANDPEVR
jgi:hypothetical protein